MVKFKMYAYKFYVILFEWTVSYYINGKKHPQIDQYRSQINGILTLKTTIYVYTISHDVGSIGVRFQTNVIILWFILSLYSLSHKQKPQHQWHRTVIKVLLKHKFVFNYSTRRLCLWNGTGDLLETIRQRHFSRTICYIHRLLMISSLNRVTNKLKESATLLDITAIFSSLLVYLMSIFLKKLNCSLVTRSCLSSY